MKHNQSTVNKTYQVTLSGVLSFEIKSFLGRTFLNQKPKIRYGELNLLNLGCGNNKFENFVNADFFSLGLRSMILGLESRPDWMLDLRFPFNCDDNVWDGVFMEHTLEHLYPDIAEKLLTELYRTMKPGSWVRITVPDLAKYISYYLGREVNHNFQRLGSGCEAVRSLTQNYFHLSVWDSELLRICLRESGFVNVQEVSFMQGNNLLLL